MLFYSKYYISLLGLIQVWIIEKQKKKKILKYKRYILDYELHYTGHLIVLKGYSDVNWLSDTKDLKFANGYVFILDGTIVSWKSSKKIYIIIFTMV
jgi:hypothetical protein